MSARTVFSSESSHALFVSYRPPPFLEPRRQIPIDEVVLSARGGKKGAEMAKKWPLHPVVEKFFADHWGRLAKRESATAFAR